MFRSFLTQEKLDQDPEKTVQSNDLSLYVPPLLTRMIKQLCIAGWFEQGGVEEGEASTVHDPQVLQGEILYSNNISEYETYDRYDIRKCCKVNRLYFNNISEYITYDKYDIRKCCKVNKLYFNNIWVILRCWVKSSMVEGRFSKWF